MALSKVGKNQVDEATNFTVQDGTIKLDGNYPVGTGNVALGDAALDDGSLSGNYNTAIGNVAMTANTSGEQSVGVGHNSLGGNTTGNYNVAAGFAALYTNNGSNNVAIGHEASYLNTSGGNNTAVGKSALRSNTTASENTAVGYQAGYSTTTGADNVFIGSGAGFTGTTATLSTFVGSNAGRAVSAGTASRNTFIGAYSGYSVTTGSGNTFIGGTSTGSGNGAGRLVTTGNYNTILGTYDGNQGGLDIRTSSNNIVLSDGDGNPRMVGDNTGSFFIRRTSTYSYANGSLCVEGIGGNPCIVAGTSGTSFYNNVVIGNGNGNVGSISTNGSSTSYNTSSDYRLKENVVDLTGAADRVQQLAPKRFNFIVDADTTVDGFLAHEVQSVVPEAVTGTHNEVDADGNAVMQGIDQSKLVPLLTAALQEALTKIDQLETRITALENA